MNIQLIATDMDGTLVNSKRTIDARTIDAVKTAINQGIIVVPATGRPYSTVPAQMLTLPEVRYIITSNGADMIDLHTKQSIYTRFLSGDEALNIIRRLSRHNIYLYIHCNGLHYDLKGAVSPFDKLFTNGDGFERRQVDDFEAFVKANYNTIEKVGGFCFDEATYAKVIDDEKKLGNINMASVGNLSLEFNSAQASKGNALAVLCEQLGIAAENVMVLGDNQNDVSMFQYAGYSVAMGNAIEELKSLASEVTESCDEFGAALAIERVLAQSGKQ